MFSPKHKYGRLPQHDDDINLEVADMASIDCAQYNYVPQHGYLFPGSGLNYIIGIDGHKSLITQKKLTRPTTFLGTLFCPCFTAEEPFSDESKSRMRNCLASFSFILALGQLILLAITLKDGFAHLEENPSFGPTYFSLEKFGAKSVTLVIEDNQVWRFFTSTFLYAGIFHAICNVAVQLRLGMYLEREWGWGWFMLTYIVAGVGGNLLSCIVQPYEGGVGSTGAIAGLVTAYGVQIALCYRVFDSFQRRLQGFQFFVFFGIVLLLVLCPYVNWSNVVGGGYIGILFGIIIWAAEEKHRVWIIPALVMAGSFAGGFCYFFLYMK